MGDGVTPAAARRRLPEVAEQLERVRARERVLLDERSVLLDLLDVEGDQRKDIAALARIEPGAVAFALHKFRAKRK